MFIKKLSLKNFRNYQQAQLDFSKNINIIIGNNAQGKTSLIEGIYALSTTKSHRTSKDAQMMNLTAEFARVDATVTPIDDEDFDLSLALTKKGKTAKYNGAAASKLTAYIGKLKTVFFAPEDLELIKGSPTIRRKFLNMEIGQIDGLYLHHLSTYNKILKQRNELLKQPTVDEIMLEVLTEQMISPLMYLINRRIWFLQALEQHAKLLHQFITDEKEEIAFQYNDSLKIETMTEASLQDKFKSTLAVDKKLRTTTVGPHRDDFTIAIDGMNAHDYASQGQQRTAILSIKLAEIDLIKEVTGDYPVLLLDDVLSELDDGRQVKLLASTKDKTQTFITTTNISGISEEIIEISDIFVVNDAKIGEYNE